MSTKANKDLIHQIIKEVNELAGDVTKIRGLFEKYYAPGYIFHNLSLGDMNREQSIQWAVSLPEVKYSIDDMVAEGDKVATRYTAQGTHNKAWRGVPATGKQISIKGVEIDKIVERKISETWDFPDTLGLMTQFGIIPAPKK